MSTERQTFVEIDLPVCSLTYGESPCTAVLNGGDPDDFGINANNTRKCYNTRSTCQDLPNYTEEDKVLRLAVATLNLDPGIMAIPSIVDVSYTPPRINLAQGLGERSVVKITVQDHPFPDTGPAGDKYLDERDFDAFGLGTFWGKFRTRYPFMRGRTLRWKTGIVGTTIDNMETRQFVIDRIDGPDVSGRVVITAKDPVSFLDDRRSLTPRLSRGLVATEYLDTGTDNLVITPAEAFEDYPTNGFVSVGGNEILQYTSKTAVSGNNFELVISNRARFGSSPETHEVGTRVQFCRVLDDGSGGPIRADEFLLKLLTEDDFGNADSGPIDANLLQASSWQFEAETFLAPGGEPKNYSGIITEPEPIADLVNEFCRSIGGSIWWNDVERRPRIDVIGKLEFQTLRANPADSNDLYNDNVILADTFQQRTMENLRMSRVWVFYAQLNALVQTNDKNNYLQAFVGLSAKSEEQYGRSSAQEIFSRFIRGGARAAAEQVAQFLLSRYALPPRRFAFAIPRDDDSILTSPILGQNIIVNSRFIQDDTGVSQNTQCQVISVVPTSTSWTVEAEEISRSDVVPPGEVGALFKIVISENVSTGLNLSEVIANARSTPFETTDSIEITILENVIITNTNGPAVTTGNNFPNVANITLKMLAGSIIQGQGGRGGDARVDRGTSTASQGERGRSGLLAVIGGLRLDMDSTATIAGGGGGGAGAAAAGRIQRTCLGVQVVVNQSVTASGGGGEGLGQAGIASSRTASPSNFRIQQGSAASLVNVGEGVTASLTSTITCFGETTNTITVTSGAGGELGEPGQGSSVTGNVLSSVEHATGGPAGFSIQGESNITPINIGILLGPQQANP